VLIVGAAGWERAVIGMTSTQLKKSRRWNAQMVAIQLTAPGGKRFTPPSYAHTYRLTTAIETKDQNTWSGWAIGVPQLITDGCLYSAARQFHADITKGTVKIAVPAEEGTDAGSDVGGVM
jgi:hypothetical protein